MSSRRSGTPRSGPRLGTAALCWAVAAVALFVGFWAFAYDGYVEDAGMTPVHSWPAGVGAFVVGGVLLVLGAFAWRPRMSVPFRLLLMLVVAGVLVLGAFGALDAGDI